tara:strand:+ start:938 stop:1591 length:654 start_codon:yes stop_codon:yes gene_type:complete
MGHMSIYDGPQGAWTVNNGAVTFDDGSGQSVPVGFPGQFPGGSNTGYSNGQWNPNFMTGFPMNNMLPVNKMGGGMPDAIPGTLPVLQPTVPTTASPTDGSLPPLDPNDPNNERGGTEGAEAHHDRVQQMAEAFYLNNPGHWMSKIDSKIRQWRGMTPLNEVYKDRTTQTRRRMEDLARRRAAQQAEAGGGDYGAGKGSFAGMEGTGPGGKAGLAGPK